METLSPQARKVIADFTSLPGYPGVRVPYYNNRRHKVRAALRAFIGKGSPTDIAEEVELFGLREKVSLNAMTPEQIRAFMIDRGLGIECSGFAYYILDAESTARGKGNIQSHRILPGASFFRKIIAWLRPVENMSVAYFADPLNSKEIEIADVKPGDIITMRVSKETNYEDHILVVSEILKENGTVKNIHYVHAIAWPEDGKYGHGVSEGTISVDGLKKLLDMRWEERGKTQRDNHTYTTALNASLLSLRRLNWF